MSDMRQGVTPTQHEALDFIDQNSAIWDANRPQFKPQLREAIDLCIAAKRSKSPATTRGYLIEAAARLIDAADEIGRLIE